MVGYGLARSALFERLAGAVAWHVELHQFRIEALPGMPGMPTPEGMHRDGVDYVLVLLVSRSNIGSGTTLMGGLAVVGPTRMDYPGTMAAVRAVARYVGEIVAGR